MALLDDDMKTKRKTKPNLIVRIWQTMFPVVKLDQRKHIMSEKTKTVKTVKAVNYTPEATKEIVFSYLENPTKETVTTLATKFGKTSRSIVAKLSREGVYRKAEYVAKNGEKPETKESKVERIAKAIGTTAEKMGGLEAATKNALDLILAALAKPEASESPEGETEGA
jgi:hypothetical protein